MLKLLPKASIFFFASVLINQNSYAEEIANRGFYLGIKGGVGFTKMKFEKSGTASKQRIGGTTLLSKEQEIDCIYRVLHASLGGFERHPVGHALSNNIKVNKSKQQLVSDAFKYFENREHRKELDESLANVMRGIRSNQMNEQQIIEQIEKALQNPLREFAESGLTTITVTDEYNKMICDCIIKDIPFLKDYVDLPYKAMKNATRSNGITLAEELRDEIGIPKYTNDLEPYYRAEEMVENHRQGLKELEERRAREERGRPQEERLIDREIINGVKDIRHQVRRISQLMSETYKMSREHSDELVKLMTRHSEELKRKFQEGLREINQQNDKLRAELRRSELLEETRQAFKDDYTNLMGQYLGGTEEAERHADKSFDTVKDLFRGGQNHNQISGDQVKELKEYEESKVHPTFSAFGGYVFDLNSNVAIDVELGASFDFGAKVGNEEEKKMILERTFSFYFTPKIGYRFTPSSITYIFAGGGLSFVNASYKEFSKKTYVPYFVFGAGQAFDVYQNVQIFAEVSHEMSISSKIEDKTEEIGKVSFGSTKAVIGLRYFF